MSLIDLSNLTEPAKVFVERVSDLIGGALRPYQIRRIAAAEADAKMTETVAELQAESLRRRTAQRWLAEEEDKQRNMEAIAAAALPLITENAQPQKIERDWLVNFFDKSRLTSDEEMQQLWAKILAGEANAPGKFSKRTINLIGSLDNADASSFQTLCRFNWEGVPVIGPIVIDYNHSVFDAHGINWGTLKHLEEIGLISYESGLTGLFIRHENVTQKINAENWRDYIFPLSYGSKRCLVYSANFKQGVSIGRVKLSRVGADIASICASDPIEGYFEHVIEEWQKTATKVFLYEDGVTPTPAYFGITFATEARPNPLAESETTAKPRAL
jgi:hypothetical protein